MKILLTVTLALLSLSTLAAQDRGITLSVSDPTVSVVREGTRYRLERQSELLPGDQLITNAGETSALIGEDVVYTLRKGLSCSLGADSLRMVNIEAGAMRIVHGGGEPVTIANPLFEATVSEAIAKFHVGDSVKVWCEQGTVSLNLLVEQQVAQSDAKSILKRVAWQQASIELSAGEAIEISPDGKHEGPYKSLDDAQDSLGLLAGIGKARQATVELLAMNQPDYNPSTATQQLPSQVAQTQQAPAGDSSSTPQVGQQYVSTLASLNIGFGGISSSSTSLASGGATADANQRTGSPSIDNDGFSEFIDAGTGGFLDGTAIIDGFQRTESGFPGGNALSNFNGSVYAVTAESVSNQNIGLMPSELSLEYWSVADTSLPADLDVADIDDQVSIRRGFTNLVTEDFVEIERITPVLDSSGNPVVVPVPGTTLQVVNFGDQLATSDPFPSDGFVAEPADASSLLATTGIATGPTPDRNIRIGQGLKDPDGAALNPNLTYGLGQVRLENTGGGNLSIAIRRSDQDRLLDPDGGFDNDDPSSFERDEAINVTPNPAVTYRTAQTSDIPTDELTTTTVNGPEEVVFVDDRRGAGYPNDDFPYVADLNGQSGLSDRLPASFSRSPSLQTLAPNGNGKRVMTTILAESLKDFTQRTGQTRFVVDGQLIDISGYRGQ